MEVVEEAEVLSNGFLLMAETEPAAVDTVEAGPWVDLEKRKPKKIKLIPLCKFVFSVNLTATAKGDNHLCTI